MGRAGAAVGSAVFFALAPGVVAGVVPWWLTGWEAGDLPGWWLPLRVAGVVLLVAGAGVLVHAFARFVAEGVGTPAPVARPGSWSSAASTATCATRCTWPSWPPFSGRRWCWAGWSCWGTPRWWPPPS